ncbi:16S rRNA (guanine(527)-N(7))-methyltransferase RsmG [Amycolatopsis antarctica]|uniref:Ribosomal RNA small subunit methyltransferase G n=2 Tax=Amycolatopsis antarctica TaxID=1854586 RepID=A0A263D2Z4_9PSEU|nr:16S rRNA (guanine(527)-N(7))-methyltransferase RsmG [Amycolatopsis antarctica]OZM72842.1 16S rRNA (guanine(527)-N(7))-methyltransferase RsmG [Amycolatopsis antarctica]
MVAPPAAGQIFGERLPLAEAYVRMLERSGVERGLIGPREVDRLWDRHVLNSAVVGDRVASGARVIDVGSGAGLPGVPLAISRPDLSIVLLEPMARRVDWLNEVVETLGLEITVVRGRAEERVIRDQLGHADVVTARAVAPLAKLAQWCLPLVRPGGVLVALKGASAAEEVERDQLAVHRSGGGKAEIVECGGGLLETPTYLVSIERTQAETKSQARKRQRRGRE